MNIMGVANFRHYLRNQRHWVGRWTKQPAVSSSLDDLDNTDRDLSTQGICVVLSVSDWGRVWFWRVASLVHRAYGVGLALLCLHPRQAACGQPEDYPARKGAGPTKAANFKLTLALYVVPGPTFYCPATYIANRRCFSSL